MRSAIVAIGVAVLLAGGTALTGCSNNNRNDPKDRVTTALKNANIDHVDVDYDRNEHVIHLKGNVDNPADRSRAEEVAERAVGTSGKVLNEVTVRGVDDKTADNNDGRIKDQLKEKVDNDPQLKRENINFDVNNGAVEVSGTVANIAEKTHVTEMVRSVDGVKEVANSLEVKNAENRPSGTSGKAMPRSMDHSSKERAHTK